MASNGTQDVKVNLYWLNKSRSIRILWLLEELKIKYDLKTFKRQKNMLAPPELQKVHPLGKSPVVTIQKGDQEPLVLAESGLIIEYLCEHFGPGYIPRRYKEGQDDQVGGENEAYMRYRWLMQFTEGTFMFYLITSLIPTTMRKEAPFFIRFITNAIAGKIEEFVNPNIARSLKLLESQAANLPEGGPWLCGAHLSAADFMISFPLLACKQFKILNEKEYPKLMAYVATIEASESYKASEKKVIEIDGEATIV